MLDLCRDLGNIGPSLLLQARRPVGDYFLYTYARYIRYYYVVPHFTGARRPHYGGLTPFGLRPLNPGLASQSGLIIPWCESGGLGEKGPKAPALPQGYTATRDSGYGIPY